MTRLVSRRTLLQGSLKVCVGGAIAGSIAGQAVGEGAGKVCADPATLDDGQKSLRESMHYSEAAPDKSKACAACAFFQAGDAGCGACAIFSGGPVNAHGHCDSWSAK